MTGNPYHDKEGKFASNAESEAKRTGMKHHVVKHKFGVVSILNEGQMKQLGKNKKNYEILSTHKPSKVEKSTLPVQDLQSKITSEYFKQVKKRGF